MDTATIIVVVGQSMAIVFAAGMQVAILREHGRRLREIETQQEKDRNNLLQLRLNLAALKVQGPD
jgi:hypothetical protein